MTMMMRMMRMRIIMMTMMMMIIMGMVLGMMMNMMGMVGMGMMSMVSMVMGIADKCCWAPQKYWSRLFLGISWLTPSRAHFSHFWLYVGCPSMKCRVSIYKVVPPSQLPAYCLLHFYKNIDIDKKNLSIGFGTSNTTSTTITVQDWLYLTLPWTPTAIECITLLVGK